LNYRKNDLPETYAALDVAVLLVPGSDGTCRAMLEAMACGRPVIGSRTGAISDTLVPGETGWLIEPGNRRELAAALVAALTDPERTRRMGQAAPRRHRTPSFTASQCEATVAVYREALARRAAHRKQ
jgi:glycosyltransferase involved in cell wall biosynthesis